MNENENLTDVETDELDAGTVEDGYGTENAEDADTDEYDDFDEDSDDELYYESDEDDDSDEDSDTDEDDDEEESDPDDPDEDNGGDDAGTAGTDADSDAGVDADAEETAPLPPAVSERELALERELNEYKRHIARALKQLGIENENALEGLQRFNAEAEGKSVEDYKADISREDKEAAEREELETYKRRQAQLKFEAKALADLAEIQKEYPETKAYKHFSEMPNSKRYAELMAAGTMSPVEAYAASHPKQVREGAAAAARQSALNDTKRHIKSNVPKNGGAGDASYISKSEMRRYRELFPDMKDEDIRALHKRASR